jgi:hypothetical protein
MPTGTEMPKFVIERQYLLPVYQRLLIEAPTLQDACEDAVGSDYGWDSAEYDVDGTSPTTITAAKLAPPDHEAELKRLGNCELGAFLYENDCQNGPLIKIPIRYAMNSPL